MKKLIYSLPTSLFEIFAVEFNGYGFEILNRDTEETVFAIYVDDKELKSVKEAVQEIFEDLGNGTLILEEDIKEENWEEKWKEHFKPIKIPPFVIIPEWEIYEGDLIPIKLKIGKAFGTGLHPSTQIVLSLIPEYIEKEDSVLDIGTGSGILSIASKKIGAGLVKGIDIQPEAVEECKTNSWENEVEVLCERKSFEDINERYDIVLANLQIDIFREAFKKISKLFRKYLIVSGIYGEKERSQILKLSKDLNLEVLKEVSKKDEGLEEKWYGFVLRHSKKD
ncbi:MAG TPA: methyltransferase domain-containing protein [Persephonella sp.]|uniref:Ribosomal protein L11 methyltransferase n=1 Tax=Persephonella marina (strain DSM 14350 / EX-H1) TaxID=123214 RepID=C0QSF8_PERMH|nr:MULTISPECIES: 50S ribosomal protein L11 methyltransferase [Persephonella]ACO03676.1 ribosomal protein L11 methyltransferase [Persephonella marina EX-H1]HCB69352.1 methyltransferase domain-containing protein [Persephonella sp.]